MLAFTSPGWLVALLLLPLLWWLHRFHEPDRWHAVAALFLWGDGHGDGDQRRLAARAQPIWLLRALLLGAVILALAGLHSTGRGGEAVTLWIDDSPSMFALEPGGTRMRQALLKVERELAKRQFSVITLRSLANPERQLSLLPSEASRWAFQLLVWADTPKGEPSFPEPLIMDPAIEHWLVSDGVSLGISRWLQVAPITKVINAGVTGENAAVTALSLRHNGAGDSHAQLLVTVVNGGSTIAVRELQVFAGASLLATWPVRLAPGGRIQRVLTLEDLSAQALRAEISPHDTVPVDDSLTLTAAALRKVPTHFIGDCGAHFQAALLAHPALTLRDNPTGPDGLNVYCDSAAEEIEGPALWVHTEGNFEPLSAEVFWHPASGALRQLSLDSQWLSSTPRAFSPRSELVLLSTPEQALIVFDPKRQVMDVRLDLASSRLTQHPEYPLLVAGMVDLLLRDKSPGGGFTAASYDSPVAILPQLLEPSGASTSTLSAPGSRDLSRELIGVALVLLGLDLLLLVGSRRLQSQRMNPVSDDP